VKAEDAIGNDSCHGQIIKCIGKVLPHIGISVLAKAFIVKSIPEECGVDFGVDFRG